MRSVATTLFLLASLAAARAAGDELCGPAPELSASQERALEQALFGLALSSAAGKSFADHAGRVYGRLAAGRPPGEARLLAVALVRGHCLAMTKGQEPARLSWHVKDHIAGMSALVPDFHEAHAIVARMEAAEARR
jgi:hypothetical protein